MILTIILAIFLALGVGFALTPDSVVTRLFRDDAKEENSELVFGELRQNEEDIKNAKALILFVGVFKPANGQTLKNLPAYTILENLHRVGGATRVWLVHSHQDLGDEAGSSFDNAFELFKKFNNDKLRIQLESINVSDVFSSESLNAVFDVVNKIYQEGCQLHALSEAEILCDCTGGHKMISIGMALTCTAQRRLAYFSRDWDKTGIFETFSISGIES